VFMTPYHVIVASNDEVYVWQFRSAVAKNTTLKVLSLFNYLFIHFSSLFYNYAYSIHVHIFTVSLILSFIWQSIARKDGREKSFHIDDAIGADGVNDMVCAND
jgi:hypothetical protein